MIKTYRGTNFLLRPNCVVSSRFVYEGHPDEDFIKVLAAFADEKTCFIDVGVNVGLYTILLCNEFQKGWLFEPNSIAAEMAKQNLAVNNASDHFLLVESAAGSENSFAKFPKLDNPLTTAKIGINDHGETIKVQVLRLDDFLPGEESFVVKVDTEGYDLEVLMGLKNLMSLGRIKICLFECQTRQILEGVQRIAADIEYTVMNLKGRLKAIETDNPDKIDQNLFLVRNDLVDYYLSIRGQL